ncbi:hypothetical protein DRI50_10365, partial [candidate division KSB1 bacterium]
LLTPQVDAVVNFEDLFVFTRMWNWYHAAATGGAGLAKSAGALRWEIKPVEGTGRMRASLMLDNVHDLAMGHVLVDYPASALQFEKAEAGGLLNSDGGDAALLVEKDASGLLDVSFSRLAGVGGSANVSGSGELLRLDFQPLTNAGANSLRLEEVDLRSARNAQVWVKTMVDDDMNLSAAQPASWTLSSYPNPFNSRTTITFDVPEAGDVRVDVVNVLGQSVRTLQDKNLAAGAYKVAWDGKDETGEPVVTGMYIIRLRTNDAQLSRKILYLK